MGSHSPSLVIISWKFSRDCQAQTSLDPLGSCEQNACVQRQEMLAAGAPGIYLA